MDSDPSTLGLHSYEGNDSNLIVLEKKKKKKKENLKPQINPKLSKSQKRKLSKIKEEKEKEILLWQSVEALEKYKIRDDFYSLMSSSQNLGKVETVREKRRREVQYSKAGLEVPYSDPPPKKTKPSHVMEEIIHELPAILEAEGKDTSLRSSEQLAARNGDDVSDGDVHIPETAIIDESNVLTSTQDSAKSSLLSSRSIQEEVMKPKDRLDEAKQANMRSGSTSTLANCSARRDVIHVSRPVEVEDKRKDLPIVLMEQEIMEVIEDKSCVIILGKTGCGKTTQIPQILYEAGYGSKKLIFRDRSGMIGVTQPRRVAVYATAERVAFELGLRLGIEVGFQVRHDKRVTNSCSIKFMTEGILLKELQTDILLRRYSVLILDEAHERSLNTDILIGMLPRIVQTRQEVHEEQKMRIDSGECVDPKDMVYPLKLILMSATLQDNDDICGERIFPVRPDIIDVSDREYPVTAHFSKRTEMVDYIGQAYKKVLSIHKRLPPGGILVFVTGQREVEFLCRKLRHASRERAKKVIRNGIDSSSVRTENATKEDDAKDIIECFSSYDDDDDYEDFLSDNESDFSNDSGEDSDVEACGKDGNLMGYNLCKVTSKSLKAAFESLVGNRTSSNPDLESKELPFVPPAEDTAHLGSSTLKVVEPCAGPICAVPLYAMLPKTAQLGVFDDVKEGERLVVVATNVAETSLTIPGIKYVVDTGREKVKRYNPSNGIETYEVQWISKASAAQRMGRAGRTGPGHCYRLYSSAVFNNLFPKISVPEICKVPLDGVILLISLLDIQVKNFPFPTPPEASAIDKAELRLKNLKALDNNNRLTSLGKAMAQFPVSPRNSKVLLTAIQIMRDKKDDCQANLVLAYAVSAAAALSFSNPFIMQLGDDDADDQLKHCNEKSESVLVEEEEKLRKRELKKQIVEASRGKFSNPKSDVLSTAYALQCYELSEDKLEFCTSYGLHVKTMEEMFKLRKQLLHIVFNGLLEFSWTHGSIEDVDRVWKVSSEKQPLRVCDEDILCEAICAGWVDRVAKRTKTKAGKSRVRVNAVGYEACMVEETVFLHRWSALSKFAPEYLVYNELVQTKRPYMYGATEVKEGWLVKYAPPSLCKLVNQDNYQYDPRTDQVLGRVKPIFGGYHSWELKFLDLPLDKVLIPENDSKRAEVKSKRFEFAVRSFACSLLEGKVLPCLLLYQKDMVAKPDSIRKPESAGVERVGNLLERLKKGKITSCAALREVWENNPRELYSEIRVWFPVGFRDKFEQLWRGMQLEAGLNLE